MKRYEIVFFSSADYDRLTAEIVFDGEEIALVQQEEGADNLIVEFYHNSKIPKVYLNDLIDALQEAQARLTE